MSLQHAMNSDADGGLLSPASSDQSKPTSVTGPGAQSKDLPALTEDTEMSELLDTTCQPDPATRVPHLSNSNLATEDRSSDLTIPRPSALKSSRTNPPRGKGKTIMVGGNAVESGSSGTSRSRNETRSSNSRNQTHPGEKIVGDQDAHRGAKVLDEHYLSQCDFGDPFLDRWNAKQQRTAEESSLALPANVPPTDNSQDAPASAAGHSDLPTSFVPPLPPSEVVALNTPAASPS